MTEKKGRSREAITTDRERQILAMIDEWDPERTGFSREALVRRVGCALGFKVSRQGLMKRDLIRLAFERREKELVGEKKPRAEKEPLVAVLERRIDELEAELKKKDKLIDSYQQLFITYRYNANKHGIRRDQLEAPMPTRNRGEGSRG